MTTAAPHGAPSDPFRLFFPLGIVLGVAGVSIWPAYFLGLTTGFSGRAHAFVQADGFLYAFVAGFLLTAIPRFTGTDAPRRPVQYALAALLILATAAFEVQAFAVGHLAFLAAHVTVIGLATRRFRRRRQPPPDSFVLVGAGMATGLVGALVNAAVALDVLDPRWDTLGRRMLTEGMVLLLVLGVGGFLGPRLLGFAPMPVAQIGSPPVKRRTSLYLAAAAVVIGSLAGQYGLGFESLAYARAAAVTAVLLPTMQPWRRPASPTTVAWCVWTGVWLVIAGSWLAAVAPAYRVDFLHVLFMGGFTLLIMAVATRVTLSHGGHSLEAERRSWPVRLGMASVLFALAARVGATFTPNAFFEQLALAGVVWIAGILFWGIALVGLIVGRGGGEPAGSKVTFEMRPVGFLRTPFADTAAIPKGPGAEHRAEGWLELLPAHEAGLQDIDGFSHLYIVWVFDRAEGFSLQATPPTDDRPHGVFATRSPRRPNPVGLTVVELLGREGSRLRVRGVDMLDGTPVLDIKPYLSSVPPDEIRRGWLAEAEARRKG